MIVVILRIVYGWDVYADSIAGSVAVHPGGVLHSSRLFDCCSLFLCHVRCTHFDVFVVNLSYGFLLLSDFLLLCIGGY